MANGLRLILPEEAEPESVAAPTVNSDEEQFRSWYSYASEQNGLNPDPDDPRHQYDYRGLWKKYVKDNPEMQAYHGEAQEDHAGQFRFPDEFKATSYDQASHDSPEAIAAWKARQPVTSAKDYELDAFNVLESTTDYNEGINQLIDKYKTSRFDDPALAKSALADYSDKLSRKLKKEPYTTEELFAIAPIKAADVEGKDDIEKIDAWEKQNIDAIQNSTDPDLIAGSRTLVRDIQDTASRIRRDKLGGHSSWVTDKFFRVAEGAVSPFLSLAGLDRADQALSERTNPQYDETVSGILAGGVGAAIPLVAASAISGGAALPVLGAQVAGTSKAMYDKSLETTGDPTKAAEAAALVGAAQLAGMIPIARAGVAATRGVIGAIAGKTAQKAAAKGAAEKIVQETVGKEAAEVTIQEAVEKPVERSLAARRLGQVALHTAESAGGGYAAAVLSNLGANIGFDKDDPLTYGAAETAIAFGILGGGFRAVSAAVEHAAIRQLEDTIAKVKAEDELTAKPEEPTPEGKAKKLKKEHGVNEYFYQAEDKTWREKPPEESTAETRAKGRKEYEDLLEEASSKLSEEREDVLYDENLEEVKLPAQEDIEVDVTPELLSRTIILPETGHPGVKPNRFVTYFARKLGATFELAKNIQDGAFGSFTFGGTRNRVRLLRSLGADPEQFSKVLGHELTHFIHKFVATSDLFENAELNGVTQGYKDLFDLIESATRGNSVTYDLMRKLSEDWRGPWTRDSESYRGNPAEVFADTGDAFILARDWMRQTHPDLYKILETSVAQDPHLKLFFDKIEEFNRNPNAETEFNMRLQTDATKKHAVINAKVVNEKIKREGLGAKYKRHLDKAHTLILNKLLAARRLVNGFVSPEEKSRAFELFDLIQRKDFVANALSKIDDKTRDILNRYMQSDLYKQFNSFWPAYELANDTIEAKTGTMLRIESDPDSYRYIAQVLRVVLENDPANKRTIINQYLADDKIATTEGLINGLAAINIITDTASVLNKEDIITNALLKGKTYAQARWEYNRALGQLARRKESIPHERLMKAVKQILNDPNSPVTDPYKEKLIDATSKGAFNVRRFLVGPDGGNIFDAKEDIAYIKTKLGPERFKQLQQFSKEFHAAVNTGFSVIQESGILTPEMRERFEINKDSYITHLVLKHFEGDSAIDGAIRQAIGSFNEVGNPLVATLNKMKAVLVRAYYQRAVNSAVNLAKMSSVPVLEVGRSRPGFNIFAERDRLSRKDPNNAYLVAAEDGKAVLYKIGDKLFEDMFKHINDFPVLGFFLDVSDKINNLLLTRAFKTVFSPAFIIGQKFYDRKLEAILAGSFEFTGGLPIHTGTKLRAIDKATIKELKEFRKSGVLTGKLKELVDLEGATLFKHTLESQGKDVNGVSVSDAMHEVFGGVEQPNATAWSDKFGLWTQEKLDKIFFTKFMKNMAEFDEIRTKLNGFRIGKEILGMSDKEAAVFARENLGVPDPLGGGYAAPLVNRMFLFGRAHLNGLRVLGNLLKNNPKNAAMQIAFRVVLPKMLVMNAIMVPLLKEIFGEEEAGKVEMLNNLIPTPEKVNNNCILLGAQDGQGNFHNFFDISLKDIQADWKAWYVRIPQSRELTSLTKVFWPLLSGLFKGRPGEALKGAGTGIGSAAGGNLQPSLQYMINVGQMIFQANPTDFFRQKGIFDRDTALGGTALQKIEKYGMYLGASQYPSFIPYNPWQRGEAVSTGEAVIQKYPLVGPLMRRLTGVSNFGLVEAGKDSQTMQYQEDAAMRLSTGKNTQKLLQAYSEAAATTSTLGKGWEKKLNSPSEARRIHALTSWHSNFWEHAKQQLRAAKEMDDAERYEYWIDVLEQNATQMLSRVKAMASSASEKKKD